MTKPFDEIEYAPPELKERSPDDEGVQSIEGGDEIAPEADGQDSLVTTAIDHMSDRDTLHTGGTAGAIPAGSIDTDRLSELAHGMIFARHYKIEERIGVGGMGTVYRARHLLMKRDVAIKILHPHLVAEENTLMRFQQEAQAAGKLDHPGIMKVYDFGIDEKGLPFLVMDLIEGRSLSTILNEEGALPVERAVKILSQVCDAVAVAHDNGIVHRDLKPSNICLVKQSDGSEAVRILDFGIAKILSDDAADVLKLTQTGEVFGSPLYMSPEQCMAAKVDYRSDIYSLGCVIYETLTGNPPLAGATVFDTFHKQIHEVPEPLAAHKPELSRWKKIDQVILKCMAKAPASRYQSARKITEDLDRAKLPEESGFFGKLKSQARLVLLRQSAKKSRIHPGLIVVVTAIVVAATVGTMNTLAPQRQVHAQAWSEFNREGQRAFDKGDYAEAFVRFKRALAAARLDDSLVEQRSTLEELTDLSRAENKSQVEIADISAQLADVIARQKAALKPQEESLLRAMDAAVETDSGAVLENRLSGMVDSAASIGGRAVSERVLERVLAVSRKIKARQITAAALSGLGKIAFHRGDLDKAESLYKESLEENKKLPQDHKTRVREARALAGLGCVRATRDPGSAEEYLQPALSAYRQEFGPVAPEALHVRLQLARVFLEHRHMPDLARGELGTINSIMEQQQQVDKDFAAQVKALSGQIRLSMRPATEENLKKAREELSSALDAMESAVSPDYNELARCLSLLGDAYLQGSTADLNHAKALYKRALAIHMRSHAGNFYMTASLSRLEQLFRRTGPGGADELNRIYGQVAALLEEKASMIKENSSTASALAKVRTLELLGDVQRRMLKLDDATKTLTRAIVIADKLTPDETFLRYSLLKKRAGVLRDSRHSEEAKKDFRRALEILERDIDKKAAASERNEILFHLTELSRKGAGH